MTQPATAGDTAPRHTKTTYGDTHMANFSLKCPRIRGLSGNIG
jgi:hypothetical protein